MNLRFLATASLAFALTGALLGCPKTDSGGAKTSAVVSKSPAPATPPRTIARTTVPVMCGCTLPVNKCGEYAELDGKPVHLKGELGLKGEMPFCGKKGLKAEVAGQLVGDTLELSSFKLVE